MQIQYIFYYNMHNNFHNLLHKPLFSVFNDAQVKIYQRKHAKLSKSRVVSAQSSSRKSNSSSSELLAITVTVSAVTVIFYFFTAASALVTTFGELMSTNLLAVLQLLRRVLMGLSTTMYFMNFIVYFYLMRAFRQELFQMLGCTCSRSKSITTKN